MQLTCFAVVTLVKTIKSQGFTRVSLSFSLITSFKFVCGGWKILDIKCAKKASHFDDRTKKINFGTENLLRYRNEWKNRIFGATLIICNGLKEQLSRTELVAGHIDKLFEIGTFEPKLN